jgi:hypothetical protein
MNSNVFILESVSVLPNGYISFSAVRPLDGYPYSTFTYIIKWRYSKELFEFLASNLGTKLEITNEQI